MIFINFIVVITILGTLINFVEPYLPVLIKQTFRYGKHSHKGAPSRLVQMAELPKSAFRHFYVFALVWSGAWMYLVLHVYVGGYKAPDGVIWLLDTMCGGSKRVVRSKLLVRTTKYVLILIYVKKLIPQLHLLLSCSCLSNASVAATKRTSSKYSLPPVA